MKTNTAASRLSLVAGLFLGLATALPASAQTRPATALDGHWHFIAAPYFWFTGLQGDISVKGVASIPIEKSFSDVIKNFHFGFLGHFEGRKDRFGFATDILYLNLDVPVVGPVPAPVANQVVLDTTVKSTVVEGLAFYRVASGAQESNPAALDVLAGARYYDVSNQLNATLPGGQVTGSAQTFGWVDALVGLRFRAPLGSRVAFMGRGDVAGFGSKVTWNVEGDLAAPLSDRWTMGVGWRHMSIDYDKPGTETKLFNLKYDGPRVWFAYAW